jgi:hypothetical protein
MPARTQSRARSDVVTERSLFDQFETAGKSQVHDYFADRTA